MIWTAFLLGFLGSLHCVGMCGPIALAVSAKDQSRFYVNKLVYNLGRTVTYAFLGLLIGTVGFSFSLVGSQQFISIALGALIILLAFSYKKTERVVSSSGLFGMVNGIKSGLGKYIKKGSRSAFLFTGILNGLLPCGMVYLALVASLAMQHPILGSLYMLFFGLGTLPTMLFLMVGSTKIPLSFRTKLLRSMPYFAMFIGILFIVRGMGLGIHYLSPSMHFSADQTEMTMCQ